jgi:hypothetical protein
VENVTNEFTAQAPKDAADMKPSDEDMEVLKELGDCLTKLTNASSGSDRPVDGDKPAGDKADAGWQLHPVRLDARRSCCARCPSRERRGGTSSTSTR